MCLVQQIVLVYLIIYNVDESYFCPTYSCCTVKKLCQVQTLSMAICWSKVIWISVGPDNSYFVCCLYYISLVGYWARIGTGFSRTAHTTNISYFKRKRNHSITSSYRQCEGMLSREQSLRLYFEILKYIAIYMNTYCILYLEQNQHFELYVMCFRNNCCRLLV